MKDIDEFFDSLSSIEIIELAKKEAFSDWGNGVPITLLFATIGRNLANHFSALSDDEKTMIFRSIEAGLHSENQSLKNALATGLLEALHNRSNAIRDWDNVYVRLGEHAKSYLNDLARMHGGQKL
jgi:hypothetical protein